MIDFFGIWYLYCFHMPLALLKVELGKADIRMDAERKKSRLAGNSAGSN